MLGLSNLDVRLCFITFDAFEVVVKLLLELNIKDGLVFAELGRKRYYNLLRDNRVEFVCLT